MKLALTEGSITAKFRLLAAFLVIVFMTGGSSRSEVQSLVLLRPMAILLSTYGILTLKPNQWRQYALILSLLLATTALTISHLIPLPPELWTRLPGRSTLQEVDWFIGVSGNWRPLSMAPETTRNALFALSVPAAVMFLAVQLDERTRRNILLVMIALVLLSGLMSLLQFTGSGLKLYRLSDDTSGLLTNRNHQAVLMCLLIPMLAAYMRSFRDRTRSGVVYLGPLLAAALAFPLVILTGSRAGLIISLISLFLVPYVIYERGSWRAKGARLWAFGGSAAVLAVSGLLGFFVATGRAIALDRLWSADEDLRFPLWQSVYDAVAEYMPWGSGIGSYVQVYQILEPDSLLRRGYSNHAHNDYLETLLTAGVPGAALLIAALALYGHLIVRSFGRQGQRALFSRLGLAIVAILAIASGLDYPLRTPLMAAIFATAIVWGSSLGKPGNEDRIS